MRVFLSHSSEDLSEVLCIVKILEKNGMDVLWSEKLTPGHEYFKQIPFYIEQAHLFIPLITQSSSERGWVHQEIGYAYAMNIPVVPVVIDGSDPIGFMGKIHAIKLKKDPLERLEQLKFENFDHQEKHQEFPALYRRAAVMEKRAEMIRQYANKLAQLNRFGIVRQKGGLSSFHIPDRHIDNSVWQDRYYPEKRGSNHKQLQHDERRALQEHVEQKGCRLIVNPAYVINNRSVISAKSRIQQLIKFLESMPDNQVVIAIENGKRNVESLTLVGDYFLAESVSFCDDDGFTNTFFTRNTAEVSRRIKAFDEELNDLLEDMGCTPKESRKKAVEYLKQIINDLH